MAGAKHIVALNTDPDAPIFRIAHLGLVADLYEVLAHAVEALTTK
jgi:electron transfer flavoprotein alpha subunit